MQSFQIQARAELELRRRRQVAAERYPMLAAQLSIGLIEWAKPLLQPYRYKCLYGGRGGGKSVAICDCLLILGLTRKIRVLCAREFQVSIKESVHALLKERIAALGLDDYYDVQQAQINGKNGSTFIFKGIRHNVQSIKSMAGLTHCWVEEAQTISAESWRILVPTIREEGSEIWVSFNPLYESDVVYQELVGRPRNNAYVQEVNWRDNPFFPAVLDEERLEMQATDPDAYHHVWEGGFWEASDAQILRDKWTVEEFEPAAEWQGPYHGADFGFAKDPTVLIRAWVYENRLYIERESYAVGLELDHTVGRWMEDIPDCERYIIRADSARPESISFLRRHGMPRIEPVKKWAGSVEDGIAYLRSFEKIVIHPRCRRFAEEARLYRYKVDTNGDVLPIVVDVWNHCVAPGTLITTDKGDIPIEQINVGDKVLTRAGFKRVLRSGVSDTNRQVFTITTRNGKKFEATENHEVLTRNGFTRVDALRYNDCVLTLQQIRQCPKILQKTQFATGSGNITGTPTLNEEMTEFTTNRVRLVEQDLKVTCIGKFGLITLDQFLKVFTSITKTVIHSTMTLPTWSVLAKRITCAITLSDGARKTAHGKWNYWAAFVRWLQNGTPLKQGGSYMKSLPRIFPKKIGMKSKSSASNAEPRTLLTIYPQNTPDSAATDVNLNGADLAGLMTSQLSAQFAASRSEGANTAGIKLVVDYVEGVCPGHVAPRVYDLTVEGQHEFFANGVLVHNCIDGTRYALSPLIQARGAAKRSGLKIY